MTPLNFSSYSRDTLEHTLRILSVYRSSLKQIGKRAEIIDPSIVKPLLTRIEYAPGMDKDTINKYADACIQSSFPEYQQNIPPVLSENSRLTGGIRIFVGDDMVDISFQRFEALLKA